MGISAQSHLQNEMVANKFNKNKVINKQTNIFLYGHSNCVLLMLVLARSMKPINRLNIYIITITHEMCNGGIPF